MSIPRPGGRILVDQLRRHGVARVFGVPGESYLALLDALYDAPQPEFIVCRMEAGAANMACAHGQLTGSPGICIVTRGPGAAHAAVGVHTARQGSVPMILLVGQVPRGHRDREAFQEVDIEAMFTPLAKWTATIDDPARIPEYLARAVRVATAGRPGPVVLALPEDMLEQTAEVAETGDAAHGDGAVAGSGNGAGAAGGRGGPAPAPAAVARARDLVAGAQRPLMIAGGGGWSAAATENVTALAQSWSLPVATAFRCQDYIDNRAPVYAGALGLGMDPRLARRAADADVLLVIGARLDEPTTGGYTVIEAPRPHQALIHVHADPDEVGAVFQPALGIVAGATEFAAAALALEAPASARWADWTRAAGEDVRAFKRPSAGPAPVGGIDLAAGIAELCASVDQGTIVTNGAGNYTLWAHRYWTFARYGTQLGPVSGAMGYGVPAGIAAKLAHPDRPVLSFNGDGCFLMCGQELATAVRHRAGVVFVVIDNGSYGTIRMHQERRYPGRPVATDLVNPDFVAYARSFGVDATSVTDTGAFVTAVRSGLAAGRPALIHVPVSPDVLTPPRADPS